jgi:Tfp pilus assembly protein PilN
MPGINLLPSSYRQSRRRSRRLRIGVVAGIALLSLELVGGITLRWRAEDTRKLLEAANAASESNRSLKKELTQLTQQAELVSRDASLAQRLRTKHRWSHLLGALARATPDNVALTLVATDPPQWTSALKPSAVKPGTPGDVKHLLEGVSLTGHAVDHADLSAFLAALHASGAFGSIELRQARRENYLASDAILFELDCGW